MKNDVFGKNITPLDNFNSVIEYENLKKEYEELKQIVNSISTKTILIPKLIEFTNKVYFKAYSECVKDYNL